jgi:hypothetical protein
MISVASLLWPHASPHWAPTSPTSIQGRCRARYHVHAVVIASEHTGTSHHRLTMAYHIKVGCQFFLSLCHCSAVRKPAILQCPTCVRCGPQDRDSSPGVTDIIWTFTQRSPCTSLVCGCTDTRDRLPALRSGLVPAMPPVVMGRLSAAQMICLSHWLLAHSQDFGNFILAREIDSGSGSHASTRMLMQVQCIFTAPSTNCRGVLLLGACFRPLVAPNPRINLALQDLTSNTSINAWIYFEFSVV